MRLRASAPTLGLLALFLAGGLVLPASSWAYRLLACGLITYYAVRTYTRRDLVGYVKLALVVAFTSSQPVGYLFIVLTAVLWRERVILSRRGELSPIYWLLVYGLATWLLNQLIEVNLLSYPFFLLSFFLPVMYFVLFRDPEVVRRADEVLEFFLLLVAVISPVILLQAALHWGQSPDWRTGGTLHAHMAGIVVSVAFVLAISRRLARGMGWRTMSGRERFFLVAGLPLVYVVDAKYVLAVLVASLALVSALWVVATKSSILPALALAGSFALVVARWDRLVQLEVPLSAGVRLSLQAAFDGFRLTPRGGVLEATVNLPRTDPLVFWIGSGGGTFLSRAANSRAYDTMQKSTYDQLAGEQEVQSKLPSFIPPFTSWIMRKHALDVIHWSTFTQATWQSGLMRWVSSLTSFLWEFGVIGWAIYLAFYARLLAGGMRSGLRLSGRSEALAYTLAVVTPFMLFITFFDVWMEIPQFAILHWGLLGLLAGPPSGEEAQGQAQGAAVTRPEWAGSSLA